jgi:hypothetical protein
MEDREWMYTGRRGRNDVTTEWIRKRDDFVERAYGEAAKGESLVPCLCSKCVNQKRKPKKAMVEHCRRSETGGSLSRRMNVAACPSPDGSSARASAKGGERGGRRPA